MSDATTSTIPDVVAALEALARTTLPDTDVYPGRPPDHALTREIAFVGDIAGQLDNPVSRGGRTSRAEEYTVDVVIAVSFSRGDSADCLTRLLELFALFESAIADDVSLGSVAGVETVTVGAVDFKSGQSDEGPVAYGVVKVAVTSRLS